ncbi:MAG: class I SAM-dependent methyltransferase [Saprospiraceae bacterium]
MLRKLYYLLPPGLRFFVRRLIYLPLDVFSTNKHQLIPPLGSIYTGRGNFIHQGLEWKQLFIDQAGLLPEQSVLDIGSGIGRIAIGLTKFLKGNYEGFDAVKLGVDWCQKNISPVHSNFHFQFIDLFNDLYKSGGKSATNFTFPYKTDQFDFACAISVFTHMIPDELENYIKELNRVLKSGGRAVLTFFILDPESLAGMNKDKGVLQFPHHPDHRHALMDTKVKSANVAYQRAYLMNLLNDHHLQITHEFKGKWSDGRNTIAYHPLAFQDILILRKFV